MSHSEVSMLTDLVKSACIEWRRRGHKLDSLDFPRHVAKVISDAGPVSASNLRLTPLDSDGNPDPNKTPINIAGPVKVNFGAPVTPQTLATDLPARSSNTPRMSHRLAQLLFGVNKPEYPHRQARRVMEEILPAVMKRYFEKAGDYDENAQMLGYRGQFADIWRKVGKLKRAWWDGKKLRTEQPAEICEDLVAQLLLALLFVKDESAAEIDDEEWDED